MSCFCSVHVILYPNTLATAQTTKLNATTLIIAVSLVCNTFHHIFSIFPLIPMSHGKLQCAKRHQKTTLRKRRTRGFPFVSTWKNWPFYIVYIYRIVFPTTPCERVPLKCWNRTHWLIERCRIRFDFETFL